MQTVTSDRVVARADNVVLVDFSRKPEPPAPRFPGAGGLREISYEECQVKFELLARYRRLRR
jgi:hypothetical protein